MGHVLARGWLLVALFAQASLAATIPPLEPTTTLTSSTTAVSSEAHSTHHWSYVSRALPSRAPCSASYSSSIPSSSITPTPSIVVSSSLIRPSSLAISSVASSSSVPSSSSVAHVDWSYSSRPLPHRTQCSASSSVAIPSSSVPYSVATPSSAYIVSLQTPLPSLSTSRPLIRSSLTNLPPVVPVSWAPSRSHSVSSSPISASASVKTLSSFEPGQVKTPSASGSVSPSVAVSIPVSTPTGRPSSSDISTQTTAVGAGASAPQLTTSTILSTRTATITACPSSVTDCPARSRTTFLTTETIVVSTTVCPVTESATSAQAIPTSTTVTGSLGNVPGGEGGSRFTTSTILSTRTATITACPSSVTDCPLRSKTTYYTTETLVVSTTVCPVTETAGSPTATLSNAASLPSATQVADDTDMSSSELTTSTVWSTRTATITACPSSVTNCPLRSKTTYTTTETVLSTTVYPATLLSNTQSPLSTATQAGGDVSMTTSAIFSTRTATIAACPGGGSDCSKASKTPYVTTETLVVATSVYPVASAPTSIPGEGSGVGAVTGSATATTLAAAQFIKPSTLGQEVSAAQSGSEAGHSSAVANTETTATAEGTVYSNSQPSIAPFFNNNSQYTNSTGFGTNHTLTVTSTPVLSSSSYHSGMTTSAISSTTAAVSPIFTGAASVNNQWSMVQVLGTIMAMVLAVLL